jgi:hypothetical protein
MGKSEMNGCVQRSRSFFVIPLLSVHSVTGVTGASPVCSIGETEML